MKSIRIFNDPAELIREFRPEIEGNYDKSVFETLDHINDFEGSQFIVFDGSDVATIDGLNGDVFDVVSLDDFISEIIDYIVREIAETYYAN